MSHSLTRIWIHTILGTKDHKPLIAPQFEKALRHHIKSNLEQDFDCSVRAIDGTANHVHVLFLLSPNFSVKDLLQNMKGESSHWVNQQDFVSWKFAWQTGYAAFSVSERGVGAVQRYIEYQKLHHAKRTVAEELAELLQEHHLAAPNETVKTVSVGNVDPQGEYAHDRQTVSNGFSGRRTLFPCSTR